MFKQTVSLVEFPKLYNILTEINNLFAFNIVNYKNSKDFIFQIESNNIECINSTIIIEKKNYQLFLNNKINKNNILVFNDFPLKIQIFFDTVNAQLIKQKYNFQSKINIKKYCLNLNSRIISNAKNELKLTEKEIDIILFLNNQTTPQSVEKLQNKVWGYSFGLETHTVETHVYRLRKKIKDKFNDENFIFSLDTGYKI